MTRALLTLAVGDGAGARHASSQARRWLGDTPQTLLLSAQAERLSGREAEAARAFEALADRPDVAFLGLRGLLRQAVAREDWTTASDIARRAEAAHPGAAWLRAERAQLALRTGAWRDALHLSGPQPGDALTPTLAAAASEAEADPTEARRLAKRAFKSDPRLTVAALAYARRLSEGGSASRADGVLRQAWAANPHPDLAEAALRPVADKLARVQAGEKLVKANPDHPESLLLRARLAQQAGLIGEARRHADAARQGGLNQRRLWVLLADIAETDTDTEANRAAQRQALRQVAEADPDPVWRCEACGAAQTRWHPVCPACHTAGRIAWITPAASATAIPGAGAPGSRAIDPAA